MAHMIGTHAWAPMHFLAFVDTAAHLGGQKCQNPNFEGVNRRFPEKRAKYDVNIIKTTASITTKFCTVIGTTKYSPWVVYICPKLIQDGGQPPS